MEKFDYIERLLLLAKMNFEYINIDAIFSDESENYRTPVSPDANTETSVRIRTGINDLDKVYMCAGGEKYPMDIIKSQGYFDYYQCLYECGSEKVDYFFELVKDNRVYYYNKQGLVKAINTDYNFTIIPNFKTPDWAKGAVMYQIYVDRFYNGDKSNDVIDNEYAYLGVTAKAIKDWYAPVEQLDVCNFYGGDLKGVMDKMSYLKDLGVEVIYFNPVFVSPSNHKYDIQDYDSIDPHYGVIINDGGKPLEEGKKDNAEATMYMVRTTDKENLEASNKLMADLIALAHKNGIKVILDGVFNHCGAFNKWLDREGFYKKNGYPDGAFMSENSPYHDFFSWHGGHLPGNESYDGWWGHSNHPKLNFEGSQELYDYILNIGKKWVSPPYNADGWRLDVAADLCSSKEYNMKFWRDFRKAVKSANPDAIILAEHYGDPKDWLMGDQWDTVMNYDAFMEPITWFLTGMEKHSEQCSWDKYNNAGDFEGKMRYYMSRFSFESLSVAMNELSNHDHSRFLTRTNKKVGRLHTMGASEADTGVNINIMREAITFQMTWIGAPTIYYGDEAGLTGWTDPDNRRTYPWGRENKDLIKYYKTLITIHKRYKALAIGSLDYLYMSYGLMCYGRWTDNEKVIVVINNNDTPQEVIVPVWRVEAPEGTVFNRILESGEDSWSTEIEKYEIKDGCIKVKCKAQGSCIFTAVLD